MLNYRLLTLALTFISCELRLGYRLLRRDLGKHGEELSLGGFSDFVFSIVVICVVAKES